MIKKLLIGLSASIALLSLAVILFVKPVAPILSGYSARMACTCHFVQNKSLQEIKNTDLSELYFILSWIDIYEEEKEVTSTTFGFHPKTAVYREGQGCILLEGKDDFNVHFQRPKFVDTFNWRNKKLLTEKESSTLDSLFFHGGMSGEKMTKAAIILHRDSIIYEKYAEGTDKGTPLLGWSMTKSVTGTLIGMLIEEGVLKESQNQLFENWKDERSRITIHDLLNMKSGIEWAEKYDKVSAATQMLFDKEDVVKFASGLGLEAEPGTHFEYSSGTSNLLSGIIRKETFGLNNYLNYPYVKLFEPLGMSTAFVETDESGNMIGSSFMYASARDWAKYGMLYLNEGKWNGAQVISLNQVSQSFESDPVSKGEYGFHFWHNDGGKLPNSPKDLIYASGYQGQRIFILPEEELIVVRLGLRMIDFDEIISTIVQYLNEDEEE